jgi:hypothetical protein
MWAVGLTMFEALSGVPAFDPKLALMKMLMAIAGAARPAIPSTASPELAQVIRACWSADPQARPTAREICEKFALIGWNLVQGADVKVVSEYLSQFGLDESASKGELAAALAKSEREVADLKQKLAGMTAEVTQLPALKADHAKKDTEIAQKDAGLRAKDTEIAQLKAEVVSLRSKLADTPQGQKPGPAPAPPAQKPDPAPAVQRGGEVVFLDGTRRVLPAATGEWTKAMSDALGEKDKVKSITFPDGIPAIGNRAFSSNPSGFRALESVTFPASCKRIDTYAFNYCTALLRVEIPSGCTKVSGRSFQRCASLREVVIPVGCLAIEREGFCSCESLTNVTIPEGCLDIGDCAFDCCRSLASVTVPSTCRTIGPMAFRLCRSLSSAAVPQGCKVDASAFQQSPTNVTRF